MKNTPKQAKSLDDQVKTVESSKKENLSDGHSSALIGKALSKQDGKQKSEELQKKEINGPKGLEPTRYGDWESKGRCYDF